MYPSKTYLNPTCINEFSDAIPSEGRRISRFDLKSSWPEWTRTNTSAGSSKMLYMLTSSCGQTFQGHILFLCLSNLHTPSQIKKHIFLAPCFWRTTWSEPSSLGSTAFIVTDTWGNTSSNWLYWIHMQYLKSVWMDFSMCVCVAENLSIGSLFSDLADTQIGS